MGTDVELLVIERTDLEGLPGFAVRCHSGTLRVGDTLNLGIDPSGGEHELSLRCIGIYLAPALPADSLETNFGGGIVLEGDEVGEVDSDWTLRASA
jgi:hypothetical protein